MMIHSSIKVQCISMFVVFYNKLPRSISELSENEKCKCGIQCKYCGILVLQTEIK